MYCSTIEGGGEVVQGRGDDRLAQPLGCGVKLGCGVTLDIWGVAPSRTTVIEPSNPSGKLTRSAAEPVHQSGPPTLLNVSLSLRSLTIHILFPLHIIFHYILYSIIMGKWARKWVNAYRSIVRLLVPSPPRVGAARTAQSHSGPRLGRA